MAVTSRGAAQQSTRSSDRYPLQTIQIPFRVSEISSRDAGPSLWPPGFTESSPLLPLFDRGVTFFPSVCDLLSPLPGFALSGGTLRYESGHRCDGFLPVRRPPPRLRSGWSPRSGVLGPPWSLGWSCSLAPLRSPSPPFLVQGDFSCLQAQDSPSRLPHVPQSSPGPT